MEPQTPDAKGLSNACRIFLKDLEALPEQAFCKCFGPKTRTVADIVYEVNLVNDHVGMVVRGEKPFDWPDEMWILAPKDFDSKQSIIFAFQESSQKIVDTFAPLSKEEMDSTVETESGVRTKSDRARFCTLHLWYHSGQLNFIQTLLGDDSMHWT